jgi:hypothetical protein
VIGSKPAIKTEIMVSVIKNRGEMGERMKIVSPSLDFAFYGTN